MPKTPELAEQPVVEPLAQPGGRDRRRQADDQQIDQLQHGA